MATRVSQPETEGGTYHVHDRLHDDEARDTVNTGRSVLLPQVTLHMTERMEDRVTVDCILETRW